MLCTGRSRPAILLSSGPCRAFLIQGCSVCGTEIAAGADQALLCSEYSASACSALCCWLPGLHCCSRPPRTPPALGCCWWVAGAGAAGVAACAPPTQSAHLEACPPVAAAGFWACPPPICCHACTGAQHSLPKSLRSTHHPPPARLLQAPLLAVVAVGAYLAINLLYGVATFRTVPEEAELLQKVTVTKLNGVLRRQLLSLPASAALAFRAAARLPARPPACRRALL